MNDLNLIIMSISLFVGTIFGGAIGIYSTMAFFDRRVASRL